MSLGWRQAELVGGDEVSPGEGPDVESSGAEVGREVADEEAAGAEVVDGWIVGAEAVREGIGGLVGVDVGSEESPSMALIVERTGKTAAMATVGGVGWTMLDGRWLS